MAHLHQQQLRMVEASPPTGLLFQEEVVLGDDGLSLAFPVGSLVPQIEGGNSFEIVVLRVEERGVLVAVPSEAWHRKAASRKLPQGALTKPLLVACQACTAENRLEGIEGSSVDVWLGWLNPDLHSCVDFTSGTTSTFGFVDKETSDPCFPFAEALMKAAQEKYQVVLPQEDNSGRLEALEQKFASLQGSLDRLLAFHQRAEESGRATAMSGAESVRPKVMATKAKAASKAAVAKAPSGQTLTIPNPSGNPKVHPNVNVGVPPGLEHMQEFAGLDPSTVAAALQAGVPRAHLATMSRVVTNKPKNMQDAACSNVPAADLEMEENEEHNGEQAEAGAGDPMTRALLQLTEIVGKLSGRKGDSLEDALDNLGGSGLVENSAGLSRKHAALINALKKTFKEDPRKIWMAIEQNMANEFDLRVSQPNLPGSSFTARGWAEHRSRIQGYPRTARAAWTISGILDALRNNCVDEARARACLALAQLEQESLDHGSFLLAQEFSLEPPAPVSSFQMHVLPDPVEMAHTPLLDSRWVDAFAHRLKEVDSYVEIRKKLGQRAKAPPPINLAKDGKAGGKGRGKNGKGKDGKNDGAADAAE